MNVLALFITIPLLIVITLFLAAIAYMQYLMLKNDKDLNSIESFDRVPFSMFS